MAGLVWTAPPAAAAETYAVPADRVFVLDGRGFGHGRGMSQWGAQGGAVLGRTGTEILDAYYPGTAMPAWPEQAGHPLRVVLTRLGEEGRRPAGSPSTDRRYECDSTGPAYCDLQVMHAPGLTLQDGAGSPTPLPGSVAVPGGYAAAERWGVSNDAAGLQLAVLAGGAWRPQRTSAGPLVFGGPPTLRMAYGDGSVREYRGRLSATRTSTSTMARLNLVPREEYLRSVVPKEVSPGWRPAALEAQSVAARTYAENYRLTRPSGSVWDICDSTFCQVYAGRSLTRDGTTTVQEASSTDTALAATRDLVRTFGGQPVRAEFSASNGGWTVSGGTSWMPARQDDWDGVVGNPPNTSHRWTATLPAAALEARFPVGRLTALVVHSRDGNGEWGGRVGEVELRGVAANGSATSVRTTGEAVRGAHAYPGASTGLRSSWWKPRPTGPAEVGGAWSGSPGTVELASRQPDSSVTVDAWDLQAGTRASTNLGGVARGGPGVGGRASGALGVVVRGSDDQLWATERPAGGGWTFWQPLGGVLTGRPAVAQFQGEELHVFVRGSDSALWHRWSTGPGLWSSWEYLGGVLAAGTGPAAVTTGPGRLEVVVHGTDHAVWRRTFAGGWSGWSSLGGRIQGDPTAASASGELTVGVVGDGRVPYVKSVGTTGEQSWWTALGGQLVGSPAAAAAAGSGRLDLLGTGTDDGLHANTRTSTGWSGWRRIA